MFYVYNKDSSDSMYIYCIHYWILNLLSFLFNMLNVVANKYLVGAIDLL